MYVYVNCLPSYVQGVGHGKYAVRYQVCVLSRHLHMSRAQRCLALNMKNACAEYVTSPSSSFAEMLIVITNSPTFIQPGSPEKSFAGESRLYSSVKFRRFVRGST